MENMQDFQEKIAQMKHDGAKKLHILSDFDQTLTKPFVRGQKVPSIMALLRDGTHLSQAYADAAHKLFNTYRPIELNPRLSDKEKKKAMSEWWWKHFKLLIASGLSQTNLDAIVSNPLLQLRDKARELLALCKTLQIPFVIMSSSGVGTYSIKKFLELQNVMHEYIHIISNEFQWDSSGKATGVKEPIIHSANKDETLIKNFPEVFAQIHERPNVIIMGDNIDDLGMVTGFDASIVVSIGFMNEDDKELQREFEHRFDLVFTKHAPFEEVVSILSELS